LKLMQNPHSNIRECVYSKPRMRSSTSILSTNLKAVPCLNEEKEQEHTLSFRLALNFFRQSTVS
uniref:Ovule protein n=1 Tax=Haemonchus placei TaxID=6290 RepID=A0A0N4W360_HAEPC